MKKLVLITLLALAPALASAQTVDRSRDAMALGIEHLNSTHSAPMVAWDDNHRFMSNLLTAVDTQVPAVSGISRWGHYVDHQRDPFRSLVFEDFLSTGDVSPVLDSVLLETEALTVGCQYDKVTTIRETHASSNSTTTEIETTFFLDRSWGPQCADARVADLVSQGINTVRVASREYSFGTSHTVTLNSSTMRDMAFVKNALSGWSTVAAFAGHFEALSLYPMVIGGSQRLELVSVPTSDLNAPVELRYGQGSGDCPAGCISWDYWYVVATPVLTPNGYEFNVEP